MIKKRAIEQPVPMEICLAEDNIASSTSIIAVLDVTGTTIEINKIGCETLGYKRKEIIGTKWLDNYVPEEKRNEIRQYFKNMLGGQTSLDRYENPIITRDGEQRIIAWHNMLLHDKSSPISGVIKIGDDITESKQTEERFQTIVRTAMDGFWITDMDGSFLNVNDSYCELIGYSRTELLSMKITNVEAAESSEETAKHLQKIKSAGHDRFETRHRRKDGKELDIEVSVNFLDMQGGRLFVFLRDVTARKQVEEALRESEERYHSLFECMAEGFAYCQMAFGDGAPEDWVYLDINPAFERITGLKGAKGKSVLQLLPRLRKTNPELFELYGRVAKGGPPEHVESFIPELGVWLSISAYSPKIDYFVAVFNDITTRKKAEAELKRYSEKLEESNSQLQQFVYTASHDLREPLRMMASFSQSLEKYLTGKMDEKAREYVGYIVSGASRMEGLLDDLLLFSRVETMRHAFQPVDMETVLKDVISNLKVSIQETKATITHDNLPQIVADQVQMAQVLQNLISNAIKFHYPGERPVLHIACKKESEWIFAVKDNGIGIPPELFGRLFKLFSRLNQSNAYPGTGMGLAITKRIVERHGGRVWVESQPGKGATFYFTLALNPAQEEIAAKEQV